jgi:hypothetical protein
MTVTGVEVVCTVVLKYVLVKVASVTGVEYVVDSLTYVDWLTGQVVV